MGMVQHHPALKRPATPVCSICIANYNGVGLLGDCLDSVLSQSGAPTIVIIVLDVGSTDGSVASSAWLAMSSIVSTMKPAQAARRPSLEPK